MKEQMTTTGNSAGISGKRAQTQFRKYLLERNMSERTITAYCYALKQFYGLYSQLTDKNLQLYKVFLIERYKPQTVNLRLRAMNCFVRYRKAPCVRSLWYMCSRKDFWNRSSVRQIMSF